MAKPMIAVTPLLDYPRNSFWMLPGYFLGLEGAGALPFMLPVLTDKNDVRRMLGNADGLLLTGGQDVDPSLYGEEKLEVCGEISPERDNMEKLLLEVALEMDMPVLGICRGIQFANVFFGGSLWQDIPSQVGKEIEHSMQPPYDRPIHDVYVVDHTPLAKLSRQSEIQVNSYHHQAIKKLAPTLQVLAYSDDNLIEAVRLPSKTFMWFVQWHPELTFKKDPQSQKIFSAFVTACKNYAEVKNHVSEASQ
ncbi:MAG: gamma-glutamyl-gamma-aminobutyrate hydrolase family protein [Burkholderiales bacterium]|nr:gamma-glutamyl-gamma-aminobutyrate hydrolase family protein [Burkholderiales bacterium]